MIAPLLLLAAAAPAAPSPTVVQKAGAEHYVWGGVNDGWHLVKRDDLSVIEERLQPGSREVRHYQARNDSAAPVDIIVTSAPRSHGDRVEAPADGRGRE
jgi:hypothetical protein